MTSLGKGPGRPGALIQGSRHIGEVMVSRCRFQLVEAHARPTPTGGNFLQTLKSRRARVLKTPFQRTSWAIEPSFISGPSQSCARFRAAPCFCRAAVSESIFDFKGMMNTFVVEAELPVTSHIVLR